MSTANSRDRYRFSFERVAADYERARPLYVEEALEWALARLGVGPDSRVLDLAAGTGKLTRQLVARHLNIVAVEPGEEMRVVLQRSVPGIEVLGGRAEAIPLPDSSLDAVTVGQAFHWFDTEPALAELHRVLRPGGGFALLWNQFNQDDPLLGAVDELLRDRRPPESRRAVWRDRYEERLFGPLDERAFYEPRQMSVDEVIAWVASTSPVIAASPEEQATIEEAIRRVGADHDGTVTMRTIAVVANKLS